MTIDVKMALLHFRTPPTSFVIDDSSWKNAAESLTVALTLIQGGGGGGVYESAIAPSKLPQFSDMFSFSL